MATGTSTASPFWVCQKGPVGEAVPRGENWGGTGRGHDIPVALLCIIIGEMHLSVAIDPGIDLGGPLTGKAAHKYHQHSQDDPTAACDPGFLQEPPSSTNLSAIGLR